MQYFKEKSSLYPCTETTPVFAVTALKVDAEYYFLVNKNAFYAKAVCADRLFVCGGM